MSDMPGEVIEGSPLSVYQSFLRKGKLAYQWDEATGKPVFFPRVLAPGSGSTNLTWRVSEGRGSVYSVMVISPKNEPAYNVVLVDMDEGYRLMSRVEGIPAEDVRIGMRVQARVFEPGNEEPPYPIFVPE
ncbi:Zn-ribbon domain-containing OB-fold protein [Achromobacter aloeverae]